MQSIQRMQEIAERLIAASPQLAKCLDLDSILFRKDLVHPSNPVALKNETTDKSKKRTQYSQKHIAVKGESSKECFERNKELSQTLTQLKERHQQLQLQLQKNKQLYAHRQLQFKGHIEQLQIQLKTKSILDLDDKKRMNGILNLHNNIIENINSIQKSTSRILAQQETQIIHFFNKKIQDIRDKFRKERIDKGEKDQEYIQKQKQLIAELQWIKNIAQKIDSENHNLMKKYLDLKSQFQIQQKDRETLFRELILKKHQNAIKKNQIRNLQLQLQQTVAFNKSSQQPKQQKLQKLKVSLRKSLPEKDKQETQIATLKSTIQKNKKQSRQLKSVFLGQLQKKSRIQKILRLCASDVKEAIMQKKGDLRTLKKGQEQERERLQRQIDELLKKERRLGLLYDKTFFPEHQKNYFEKK